MKGVSKPQTVVGFAGTGGVVAKRLNRPPNRTRLSIVLAALPLLFALTAFGQQPTRDDAEQHYRRAQQALERKDYKTAAEAWRAITALMPDLPEARANLGMIYHLQRKYEQAIREFREALRRNPRLPAAKILLGVDYYLTSRPELAIDELAEGRGDGSSKRRGSKVAGIEPSSGRQPRRGDRRVQGVSTARFE